MGRNREANHGRGRSIKVYAIICYHTLTAALLFFLGCGLFGVGIWLAADNRGASLDLDYIGNRNSVLRVLLGTSTASIVIGLFIIFGAISGFIAISRKWTGTIFRAVYTVFALCIFASLIYITVAASVAVANRDSRSVRNFLQKSWANTVTENERAICSLEKNFGCRSFADTSCRNEVCANCAGTTASSRPCFNAIKAEIRRVFLPIAIISALMAAIVFGDVFAVCCL